MKTNNRARATFSRRMVVILLTAVMALSFTACGNGETGKNAEVTTTQVTTTKVTGDAPTEIPKDVNPGQWHEDSSSVAETTTTTTTTTTAATTTKPKEEPSSQSTGSYTYTIYGDVTVTMDVDINKYMYDHSGGKWFDLVPMIYDLGWAGADKYTVANWGADDGSTSQTWYTYHSGDMVIRIDLSRYSENLNLESNSGQLSGIAVSHCPDGDYSKRYYEDNNPLHMITYCDVKKHYNGCKYRMSGLGWHASYDDIVLLTYIFWSETRNPGNSPLVLLLGTDRFCAVRADKVYYELP